MSYTVDWIAKNVFIPVSDLVLTSGTEYELYMQSFLNEIRRLEWEYNEGAWALAILDHTNVKTIAGANYDPFDEIINGYTITFDPLATKVLLRGSNNNIIDALVINGVSVIPTNSLGATTITTGSGVTDQDKLDIANRVWDKQLP